METLELVRTVSPVVRKLGAAWYFTPETMQVGAELGLDGFRFYFLGRGGVLGDVEWPVVHAAFGYFEPSLLEKMWTSGSARARPRDAARAHLRACAEHGRRHLSDVDGLGAFCEAAEAVVREARRDPAGLSLFAGVASEPLPDDLPGRAMVVTAVLRELRGSAHLLAVAASGLPTPVAHRISRPDDMALFGWGPGSVPEPTAADRAAHRAAEELTDQMVGRFYAVVGGDAGATLVDVSARMLAAAGS